MGIIKHPKLEQLEQECSENLKAALSGEEAFTFAEFNEKGVENRGFSNYSYWGSTFYAFSKNKLAVFLVFTELYNILDNIPSTIVLILVSYMMKPGVGTIILAMSLTGWIGMARFIRNQIIIIRDREYNLASRCLGTPVYRIILRNLLPYLVSVVMLRMALSIPEAIGSEVFITYIGLGLPATIPSLGNLINEGRTLMMSPNLRYQLIYPTIVLSIVTISFYVVGNAFSDAADPKNHRHR